MFVSPAGKRLDRLFLELNDEERIDLLALGWLGQRDSDAEWQAIFDHACTMMDGYADEKRFYVLGLGVHLARRLQALDRDYDLKVKPCPSSTPTSLLTWSARSSPSPKRRTKDAIWWAVARIYGGEIVVASPEYARTRHEALDRLVGLIAGELDAGRRVLVGFDFPFGYPAGVATHLTGQASALALWDWLAERIEDGPDNDNNRYAVAAEINAAYPGIGPFWGRADQVELPDNSRACLGALAAGIPTARAPHR